jgi:transposase-like protein
VYTYGGKSGREAGREAEPAAVDDRGETGDRGGGQTPSDPVSVLAGRYGMHANHLFNWLQQDRDGRLDRRSAVRAPRARFPWVLWPTSSRA